MIIGGIILLGTIGIGLVGGTGYKLYRKYRSNNNRYGGYTKASLEPPSYDWTFNN